MHVPVALGALTWLVALVVVIAFLGMRRSSTLDRLLALDTLSLVLIGILSVAAALLGEWYALDAALLIALLSFVGTLAAIRYLTDRRPLG